MDSILQIILENTYVDEFHVTDLCIIRCVNKFSLKFVEKRMSYLHKNTAVYIQILQNHTPTFETSLCHTDLSKKYRLKSTDIVHVHRQLITDKQKRTRYIYDYKEVIGFVMIKLECHTFSALDAQLCLTCPKRKTASRLHRERQLEKALLKHEDMQDTFRKIPCVSAYLKGGYPNITGLKHMFRVYNTIKTLWYENKLPHQECFDSYLGCASIGWSFNEIVEEMRIDVKYESKKCQVKNAIKNGLMFARETDIEYQFICGDDNKTIEQVIKECRDKRTVISN